MSRAGLATVEGREVESPPGDGDGEVVEVSVVMPCLNEADTLETCIRKAQRALCDERHPGRGHRGR